MMPVGLIFAASLLGQSAPAPEAAGRRVDLGGEATAYIPAGYRPVGGTVDVLMHLHGAPGVVEPALGKLGWPAVLVEVNRSGLSRAYAVPFSDRALFPRLLDGALKAVRDGEGAGPPMKLGRVAVSSFSAGFGGVRELLKVPEHFARIDVLVMADSLYCGYEGDQADRKVDPALMAGFRAFALKAAAGEKTLILTHSAQVPEGYASTTETADDLMKAVDGQATPRRFDWGGGWVQSREFTRGKFRLIGFEGEGPEDHMRHLRRIGEIWALTSRTPPAPTANDAATPARSGMP